MMEGGKRQWASMPRVSYTRKFAPPTEENGTGATPDDEKKPDTNSKNTNTSNTAPVVDHVAQKNEEKKQDRKDSTNGEQTKRALVNLTKSQPASSGSSNNSDDQPSKILSRHNDDKLSTLISEVANLRQSIDAVSKQVTRLQSEQSTSKDILALLEKNLTRNELATKIEDVIQKRLEDALGRFGLKQSQTISETLSHDQKNVQSTLNLVKDRLEFVEKDLATEIRVSTSKHDIFESQLMHRDIQAYQNVNRLLIGQVMLWLVFLVVLFLLAFGPPRSLLTL